MFDAGEGAQMAYGKAGLGWNKKMSIYITHLHGDHCLGALGLLQTMSLQKRQRPLSIYGPRGTKRFIELNMEMLDFRPSFDLSVCDIADGVVCQTDQYTVRACSADHGIIAYSYVLEEKEKPGQFYPDQAKALGVPKGRLWSQLQRGKSVDVSGRTITPAQVLGKRRPGIKIGYSGDTRPTKQLENFFTCCNYLIFDSTFAQNMARRAEETRHTTAHEAATLAKNACVVNLVLTHFSARYVDESVQLEEARRIHGSVSAARDMMVLDLS